MALAVEQRTSRPGRYLAIGAAVAGVWAVAGAQDTTEVGEATHFLLAFAAVLVAAKVGGELFERIKQPAVLGELVIGIVLGNLGLAGVDVFEALKEAPFLAIAAEIGAILLLFQVGLESNLDKLVAVGPSALAVAVLGVLAPIGLGYAASSVFMPEDAAWYVHLFVGATLAATSVGITARVLHDIGQMESRESRIIMGAAIVDDVLGLIILAFVLGLVGSEDAGAAAEFGLLTLAVILAKAIGFLLATFLVSRTLLDRVITLVLHAKSQSLPVVLGVAYCFLISALAELVGLASIVGAFAAGLMVEDSIERHFGRHSHRYKLDDSVTPIAALFVPVFFVDIGLQVDLPSLAFTEVLVFGGVLTLVAIVSKQICSLGVTDRGINRWAVGLGMVPRGEVGLIFAGVGTSATVAGAAVFSPQTFSAIIVTVMATTLATPPLLKAAFARRGSSHKANQAALFNAGSNEDDAGRR